MPTARELAACQADPVRILRLMGKEPLPWQEQFLRSDEDTILNIHRKGAKSFTVGVKVTHRTQFKDNQLAVIVCPSRNQSQETMRFCLDAYYALGQPVPIVRASEQRVEFVNGSRIISLPGVERTIRTYGPQLIVIDEAARVPDTVYEAVRPMRAHSKGQLILPSTPAGQRGFFYHEAMRSLQEAADGKRPDFKYIVQTADKTPWITKEFLEREERSRGKDFVQQEYFCSFTHVSGLIYPDFSSCLVEEVPHLRGRLVGGIDWGWTDPFAALWGIHDLESDTLWILGERYLSECMPHAHAQALKAKGEVEWVADPHNPTNIRDFRAAGLSIRPAKVYGGKGIDSEIEKVRIPLVTQRIQTGRLKVWRSRCPNIIKESQMYARAPEEDAKGHRPPIDGWNHCVTGDTWIDTVQGQVQIRDLVNTEPYVWCFYGDMPQVRQAYDVRKTRESAEIIKITFDIGIPLKITPDHLVMLKSGQWLEAGKLRPGHRVRALFKCRSGGGHVQVRTGRNKSKYENAHRIVWESVRGTIPKGHVIHHLDENKLNNHPDNLACITRDEHVAIHHPMLVERARAVRTGGGSWNKQTRPESECAVCGKTFIQRNPRCTSRRTCSHVCHHKLRLNNHCVLSVEPCGTADVYNMEVDGLHNFVANGVCVHNCFDALGYLITHIDRGQIAKLRARAGEAEYTPPTADAPPVDRRHMYELAASERASWERQAIENPAFWVGDDD